MKKLFLLLSLLTLLLHAELSVKKIEKMVIKIHEKREGVKIETLEKTHEPFLTAEENTTKVVTPSNVKKESKLELHAVVNGKAYINDKWYHVDDEVLSYHLKFIGKRGVVLRNGNTIKKLYLRKKRENFINLEER